ncbi:MAG: DUF72 domain-containing protein [Planctomycetota bacterium]
MPSSRRESLGKFQAGTSGWSYGDWVGPFYPDRTPASRYLKEYTGQFSVVEIDSTFYAIPARSTVEAWAKNTPDDFRFAPKLPGSITHGAKGTRPVADKVLKDEDNDLDLYLEAMEPLFPKIACLLFQFPYFRVKELQGADFVDRLARVLERVPKELRLAVEIRNKPWIREEYLSVLRQHRAAAVLLDHPYMPSPRQQLSSGMITTDFSYVRLLGDRYKIEEKTKEWGTIVEDKTKELLTWAEVIGKIVEMDGIRAAYTFANNHFAGHGPATVRQLVGFVDDYLSAEE